MMKKTFLASGVLVIGSLLAAVAPAQAGLLGSQVTIAEYYPDSTTQIATTGPVTVSSAIEFPNFPPNESVDVTDTQIIYTLAPFAQTVPDTVTFDGLVFDFSGASAITNVSVDSASNFSPLAISFTSDEVIINYGNQSLPANIYTVFDLQFSAVPEPASMALLGTSLFGLGLIRRRRV